MKFRLIFSLFIILGLSSCKNDATAQNKAKQIETQIKKDSGILIDVRTIEEWNSGHHPKAIHISWDNGDFQLQSKNWDPNKAYYLHCAAGGRSGSAAEFLKGKGFKKVYNLGGYDDVKNLKLD